jgi:hypothetical protein
MANLHFVVETNLVLGGRLHVPCAPNAVAEPGQVQKFFLAAWVGAKSKQFSLHPIALDGTSVVRLALAPGDVDTLKLAVTFNMTVPKGTRNCHLASSFIPISDLLSRLSQAPKISARDGAFPGMSSAPAGDPPFPASLPCFSMRDNFTKNTAVLRFRDVDSATAAHVARLALVPSSLHSLDRTNQAIVNLGQGLQRQIAQCAVSPLNAGPQYMEAFTYGQMQNLLTHYSILGSAFSAMSSPVDLPWIMYDAYQAVQSTGLHPCALSAMSDVDLVLRFGLPMISRHTACALSSVYCTDYTVNPVGQTCKLRETEDIAKTYSKLSLETQGLSPADSRPYVGPSIAAKPSLGQCLAGVADAQHARRSKGLSSRMSYNVLSDDCENAAQSIMMKGYGLANVFRSVVSSGRSAPGMSLSAAPPPDGHLASKLAPMMVRAAAGNRLFASITQNNHVDMAPVLVRLGRLLHTGEWTNSLAVVSAKGPSYTPLTAGAPGALSGHGTVIARIKDEKSGMFLHCPVEGTTYLGVDAPPPPGCASSIHLRLSDGSTKSFDLPELGTVLAQNVHQLVGISPDCCVLAHIRSDYGEDSSRCPFYVSAFYTGLPEAGNSGGVGLGCIPLDTNPPAGFGAGSKPLFGAPVTGLSHPTTMAVPVTSHMLASTPAESEEILRIMHAQISEAWSPEADPATIATIASYWQPCDSPDGQGVIFRTMDESARCIRSENTWAFDNPENTAHAASLYRELASRFNAIQSRDPDSDGTRAHAFGQYLSAVFRLSMPIPRVCAARQQPPLSLSAIRNLRRAATELGVVKLAACPLKMSNIHARAKVDSAAHFYMCDRGNGLVHSHRVQIG